MTRFVSGEVDSSSGRRFRLFIKKLGAKRVAAAFATILLLLAIPITVFVSLQRQNIRQRAAEPVPPWISVSPSTQVVTVNIPFTVSVQINSGTEPFSDAKTIATLSSNLTITNLSVTSKASKGCNMTFTSDGVPSTTNPSFAGKTNTASLTTCTVYTMTIKPTATGTGSIEFTNSSITSAASGADILKFVVNGSYTIGETVTTVQISKGTALGKRPAISGAMGWSVAGITGREIFFQKAKQLGINKIRLMHVLQIPKDKADETKKFALLDHAIKTITVDNNQEVTLCLGDLGSPLMTDEVIAASASALQNVLQHLITTYPTDKLNSMPIELTNEYAWPNTNDVYDAFLAEINKAQTGATDKNLSFKIIAPSNQRASFPSFIKQLDYFKTHKIPLYAVSAHYYYKGVLKPDTLLYSTWLTTMQDTMKTYGYENTKLYINEYGYNGNTHDETLKTSVFSAWLASRLGDPSYYTTKDITHFFIAAYSQPFDAVEGGYGGFYSGFGGSQAPYPTAREVELEKKLGDGTLYSVTGISSNLAAKGIGGVTDGLGNWLVWNMTNTAVSFQVSSTTPATVGFIDDKNGNSKYVIDLMGGNKVTWNEKTVAELDKRSNPLNDPVTGQSRSQVAPTDENVISTLVMQQGVAYIGNTTQTNPTATPTPTDEANVTSTPTPTPTGQAAATVTPTKAPENTPTPTEVIESTSTPTLVPTSTPTPTILFTATNTPTVVPSRNQSIAPTGPEHIVFAGIGGLLLLFIGGLLFLL